MADGFGEIGASGRRYDRDEVLDVLRERPANPPEERLRASEFAVRELAPDLFLLGDRSLSPGRARRPRRR